MGRKLRNTSFLGVMGIIGSLIPFIPTNNYERKYVVEKVERTPINDNPNRVFLNWWGREIENGYIRGRPHECGESRGYNIVEENWLHKLKEGDIILKEGTTFLSPFNLIAGLFDSRYKTELPFWKYQSYETVEKRK